MSDPTVAAPLLGAVALATPLAGLAWRRRQWRAVVLEDLLGRWGGTHSVATAVNARGWVAGTASGRAFLHRDGLRLGLPCDGGSEAWALDERGTVAGCAWGDTTPRQAVLWPLGGGLRRLPPLPGDASACASGTAPSGGLVVGWSRDGLGRRRAVLWEGGRPVALPDLGGGEARAVAVADTGTVVGSSRTRAGAWHACVWDAGRVRDLGTLGGTASAAAAVDAAGRVAGVATTAQGLALACVWDGGGPRALITPPGSRSEATGLNDAGLVVGWCQPIGSDDAVAAVWDGERRTDLGALGGTYSHARAVSPSGVVVGDASTGAASLGLRLRPGGWSWERRAFRWQAPA